jgi:manganese transport protein
VKAVLSMTLGVMTAIGGFVDIGNLVTSGITGARFGMTLASAVLVGTIGMALFAEMAGRVTAVTRKPIFHVVRERLGVRVSLVNAAASTLLNVLTLAAELGGVSLVLQMATGISYLIWVPLAGLAAWLVIWKMPFGWMENVFGLLGLGLIVFVVALFRLPTDWPAMWHQATHPRAVAESRRVGMRGVREFDRVGGWRRAIVGWTGIRRSCCRRICGSGCRRVIRCSW